MHQVMKEKISERDDPHFGGGFALSDRNFRMDFIQEDFHHLKSKVGKESLQKQRRLRKG